MYKVQNMNIYFKKLEILSKFLAESSTKMQYGLLKTQLRSASFD